MDLLAPFVYGGHWHFAEWTESYWSKLMDGNIHETSVYLGVSVLVLVVYAWIKRRQIDMEAIGLWFFILVFFFVLALGPEVHVWGWAVPYTKWLPYHWLEMIVPGMKVSGFPARMAVMVVFAAALIAAGALKLLFAKGGWQRWAGVALTLLLVVEYFPKNIPAKAPAVPPYVEVLRQLPAGGVLEAPEPPYPVLAKTSPEDLSWDMYGWMPALYHQTVHGKPIAFGFMPRQPASIHARDVEVARALVNEQFDVLRDKYDIRYVVLSQAPERIRKSPYVKVIYQADDLYVLGLQQPTFRAVVLPVAPIMTHELRPSNGKWESVGGDGRLVLALPKPEFVTALRIKCRYDKADGDARLQVYWRKGAQDFVETERTRSFDVPTGEEKTITVAVNDTIDTIRIDPDVRRCIVEISEVALLLPQAGSQVDGD
jgi:hypothetical protein